MYIRLLLIIGSISSSWIDVLKEALGSLGELQIITADDAVTQIAAKRYDVVIVDTTFVEEVELLISRLRAKQPECRIVVMTASPTWQRARAAFEAGAIDYIPKSFNTDELLNVIKQVLRKPLPRWPH